MEIRRMIGVLVASLLALARPDAAATAAVAAAAPPPEIAVVAKALESAGRTFSMVGPDKEAIVVDFATERYRDLDGDLGVRIMIGVHRADGRPWMVASAYNLYSLFDCEHPSAARRVLMGAADKLGMWSSFMYDESDGTVTCRIAVPFPSDGIDGGLLDALLGQIVEGVDALDPVLRRAMHSGMVDWPSDDLGPKTPTGWLEGKDDEGNPVRIGWALWPEKRAWAATLIAADPLLRHFCTWDDEQRDTFGRQLARDFGTPMARSIFVNWLQGSQYIEQHYPPVAVRFFAPEGTTVSATVRCPRFARSAATDERTVDAMGHIDVEPMPAWNDEALLAIDCPTAALFEVEVSGGGKRARADAAVEIQPVGCTELGLPATMPVAVYINESHPWVRDLCAEAGKQRVADSLGYSEDTDYVDALRQVYAVWRAFRARDLKYVGIQQSDGTKDESQAIRQFHESIADEGANCADGTAAIASVLQALGFDVHLMQVPGHVLVGVYVKKPKCERQWIFVETTALGEDAVVPGQEHFDEFEDVLPARLRDAEWECFEAACAAGQEAVGWALRSSSLVVASLEDLRKAGLRPIPASRSALGRIPPPPPQEPITARRDAARRDIAERAEAMRAWIDSLPNKDPVPYADVQAVVNDAERVGTDPMAMGRLLRAVDGTGVGLRCMRALAVLRDALAPVQAECVRKFAAPLPGAGNALRLPADGGRIELARASPERHWIKVRDDQGEDLIWLLVRSQNGGFTLEGEFLDTKCEELVKEAIATVHALRDGALDDDDGLRALGKELAERVRSGAFPSPEAVAGAVQAEIGKRLGRAEAVGAK